MVQVRRVPIEDLMVTTWLVWSRKVPAWMQWFS